MAWVRMEQKLGPASNPLRGSVSPEDLISNIAIWFWITYFKPYLEID